MFRRKSLVFMLLFFFIFMSIPIQAFDVNEISEGVYIYDEERVLKEDVEDELRKTLIEFEIQTDIRVIVVTLKDGKINEIKENIIEKCEDNEKIIIFSRTQRTVICSDNEINLSKHIKNILIEKTDLEYNNFIKNSIMDFLNQIAEKEKVSFKTVKEEIHLIDFFVSEDLDSLRKIVTLASVLIISLLIGVIIDLKIIGLCIRELRENFFGSKFE